MSFRSDIGQIGDVANFAGGNDAQRNHLNNLVSTVNAVLKAANNNVDDDVPKIVKFLVVENGSVSTYEIPARRFFDELMDGIDEGVE